MSTHRFTVPLAPVPKGRPRFGNGRTYTPAKTRAFEQAVALYARAARLPVYDGPIRVDLWFYVARPKKPKHARPVSGGDLDNHIKCALDSLAAHFNDALVVELRAERWYVEEGASPRVTVAVTPV